jgi:hypothetical protein
MGSYFSTDNTQYLKNSYLGGKSFTGAYLPWNVVSGATMHTASGHPEYFYNAFSEAMKEDDQAGGGGGGGYGGSNEWEPSGKADLETGKGRLDSFNDFRQEKCKVPRTSDYLEEDTSVGLRSEGYYWNGQIISAPDHETTVTQYNGDPGSANAGDFTSRTRKTTRVSAWVPKNSKQNSIDPFDYIQYRSLVFEYRDSKEGSFPTFDSLFGASNDEFLPSGAPLSTDLEDFSFSGTTGYFPFQDGNNGMNITWALTWSAPCGGINGCTDP